VCACVCVRVCVFVCVRVCVCVRMCVCVCTCMHACGCLRACEHVFVFMCKLETLAYQSRTCGQMYQEHSLHKRADETQSACPCTVCVCRLHIQGAYGLPGQGQADVSDAATASQ